MPFTLSIAKKDNNVIVFVKSVNAFMKLIHFIEGDDDRVKIAPRKIKQPNINVL